MSHTIWFNVPLRCHQCGDLSDGKTIQMYSSNILIDSIDQWVKVGDKIEAESEDFAEAYFLINEPKSATDYTILEQWSCPHCAAVQWAKISFEKCEDDQFRLLGVESIKLNEEYLFQFNFISRKLEYEIASPLQRENLLEGFKNFL